jgi:hypothetical protein
LGNYDSISSMRSVVVEEKVLLKGNGLRAAVLVACVAVILLVPYAALCDEGAKVEKSFAWPAEIDGWKVAEGPDDYDRETAFKYMDGAAELFLAYDMKALTVLRYEKQARPAITAEIFRMGSGEDAYGLFYFESDDPGAGIGQGSEFGGGLLRFWKGRYFASIYGENIGADVEASTLRIGQSIAASIDETGSPPKILSFLPEGEAPFRKSQVWFLHSHILLNQRFFIENRNVLNLAKDVNVALGRYGTGKEKVHLVVAEYPSTNKADQAASSFKSACMVGAGGKSSMKTDNGRWIVADTQGAFVVLVFNAPDEPFALRMIGNVIVKLPKEAR